jgi:AbrB family looped-hinge helix DNA binding protein
MTHVGRRGTVVIPAALRRKFGLDEGSQVLLEEQPTGLLLRRVPVIERAERDAVIAAGNAGYAALREDTAAWDEFQREIAAWDVTLADGRQTGDPDA